MVNTETFFRRAQWVIAILITGVSILFHLYYWLHVGGLWRDEVNLVNLSGHHTLAEMERDSFPLLMPVTLHAWMAVGLGNSDLALRLLGLLIGLGILAALWVSSWKIRREPPMIGLVLLSLNNAVIFFGDSLRAYGLGSLLAVILTASAFVYVQRPSMARAAWLALFAILSVQILYHNAVLVAAVCFGAWAVCWRRKDGRAALQVLAVAVLSAASLLPYAHTLTSPGDPTLHSGVELPRLFATYTDTLGYPRSGYIYIWAALYAVIVTCACTGFWKKSGEPPAAERIDPRGGDGPSPRAERFVGTSCPHPDKDLSLFAAKMLTVAVVGFPVFFWRSRMPMQSWYLLPFLASTAVCFDAALPFRRAIGRAFVLVFVLVTASLSIPETNAILKSHFSDVDIYARQLTVAASPDDYIIVEPWHFGITFGHYFKGRTPWDTLPPISDHATHRFDLVALEMQNTNAIAPVLEKIGQTLQSSHRVWVLSMEGRLSVPGRGMRPPATLPVPPLPDTGWADWPYDRVWAAQVMCFIADHSGQFQELKSLSNERSIAEEMSLFMAQGWNTNSAEHK
ncbi:MAG TPA: hypothetical protein VMF08_21935 [Candidatus Sulfotelmatobacter sp.]|nr:hypothetical protein [Candidatus Sulfotelmatobacter sp.]